MVGGLARNATDPRHLTENAVAKCTVLSIENTGLVSKKTARSTFATR
jgi:hypothetical protein